MFVFTSSSIMAANLIGLPVEINRPHQIPDTVSNPFDRFSSMSEATQLKIEIYQKTVI